jgi:hypothetical protein
MTMRLAVFGVVALGLAACAPEVPESGVGFDSYQSYAADRDAQLRGEIPPSQVPPSTGFDPARVGAAIDAADPPATTGAPLQGTVPLSSAPPQVPQGGAYGAVIGGGTALEADRPRGNAPAGIAETTSEMAGAGSAAISDEQDFNAVAARETIESDRQRRERNQAQYQVIAPTALPERTGDTGPNIVAYALGTTNQLGEPIYRRSGLRLTSSEAACKRYRSPDQAQEAFLESGGPERDPKGLDPDGDGFACKWDPRPFRTALQ